MSSLSRHHKGEIVKGGNKFGMGVVVGGALMFFFSGLIHTIFLATLIVLIIVGAFSIFRRL